MLKNNQSEDIWCKSLRLINIFTKKWFREIANLWYVYFKLITAHYKICAMPTWQNHSHPPYNLFDRTCTITCTCVPLSLGTAHLCFPGRGSWLDSGLTRWMHTKHSQPRYWDTLGGGVRAECNLYTAYTPHVTGDPGPRYGKSWVGYPKFASQTRQNGTGSTFNSSHAIFLVGN